MGTRRLLAVLSSCVCVAGVMAAQSSAVPTAMTEVATGAAPALNEITYAASTFFTFIGGALAYR